MLTYLNVRSYGYANMKAIGSLFSPGFDSSDDCQCKEEAKDERSTGVTQQYIIFSFSHTFINTHSASISFPP